MIQCRLQKNRVNLTPLNVVDADQILKGIDTSSLIDLRDRALIGVMSGTGFTAKAAVQLLVKDVYIAREKSSYFSPKQYAQETPRIQCNGEITAWIRAYIKHALLDNPETLLFRGADEHSDRLLVRPMSQQEVFNMFNARTRAAGIRNELTFSMFRRTGLAEYMKHAQWLKEAEEVRGSPRKNPLRDIASPTFVHPCVSANIEAKSAC